MRRHAVEQLPVPGCLCRGLVNHNDIQARHFCLVLSKRFPDNALDSVSAGCLPTILFRNCEAQPRDVCVIRPAKYGKPFVPAARRFFEHAAECSSIQEPVLFLVPVE
jgi:hypothetical protein